MVLPPNTLFWHGWGPRKWMSVVATVFGSGNTGTIRSPSLEQTLPERDVPALWSLISPLCSCVDLAALAARPVSQDVTSSDLLWRARGSQRVGARCRGGRFPSLGTRFYECLSEQRLRARPSLLPLNSTASPWDAPRCLSKRNRLFAVRIMAFSVQCDFRTTKGNRCVSERILGILLLLLPRSLFLTLPVFLSKSCSA